MAKTPRKPVTGSSGSPELRISVLVQHLAEQSDPQAGEYAFSYTVTIENTGTIGAQVVARHWVITDQQGHQEEVRGLAVVGHQPLLQPGERFEYTSWTRLATPQGSMRGTYFCMTEDAYPFEAPIAEFALSQASALH